MPPVPLQWPWPRAVHEFLIEVFREHLSDKGREKNRIKLYPPFPPFRSDVSLRSFQLPSTLSCGHAGLSDCHGNSMDGDVDGYITTMRAYSTLHLSTSLPHVAANYKSRVWIGESSLVTFVVKGPMRPCLSDDEICWRWKEEDRSSDQKILKATRRPHPDRVDLSPTVHQVSHCRNGQYVVSCQQAIGERNRRLDSI